jgi:hypothetical protein
MKYAGRQLIGQGSTSSQDHDGATDAAATCPVLSYHLQLRPLLVKERLLVEAIKKRQAVCSVVMGSV